MQAPIEVFESVIDEASDNPASLRPLSLTCRAFLPHSRYHLFSCIVIRSVEQMESSSEFLDACPWLPLLVRKVVLSVQIPDSVSYRIQVPEDNSVRNVRLLDVVPVYLLSRLPNLRAWGMEEKIYGAHLEKTLPWLSFHRSALWRYQRYGGRIQNLELMNVKMGDMSDFMGLLAAFTGIHSLTCSGIYFRRPTKPYSLYDSISARNMLAKSLRIESLVVGPFLDICATEYLLAASAATLHRLVITIQYQYKVTYSQCSERLETAMSQLSHLSSLTLRIPGYGNKDTPWMDTEADPGVAQDIRIATRVLKCIRREHLKDVDVDIKMEPMAPLGCWISRRDRSSEACEALEDALLTLPSCSIVLHDTLVNCRAGRTQFWSETINGAFPRLKERGLFTFIPRAQTDTEDPYGHETQVSYLVASRDSKRMVTASTDGTIIVWDTEWGKPVHEWIGAVPAGPIHNIALSPDGQRLVSVGGVCGGPPVIWDVSDGNDGGVRKVATLELEGDKGLQVCAWSFDGALIASVSGEEMVYVWDPHTFQRCGGLMSHSPADTVESVDSLQFSPNSHYLGWISRRSPQKCCIFQPLTEKPLVSYFVDPDPQRQSANRFINSFSFDPESRRIAIAHGTWGDPSEENLVRIWDIAMGTLLVVLGHTWNVTGVSFSPDGRSVLSTSVIGSMGIWDAGSGKLQEVLLATEELDSEIFQLHGDRDSLRMARFSPDGRYVAIACGVYHSRRNQRGLVSLWRTNDASCVVEFIDHGAACVVEVAFSPNGEFLASADERGIVHIRRLSNFIGN